MERALRPVRGGGGAVAPITRNVEPLRNDSRGLFTLDDKSKQLIELLQIDGRRSYATLAKEVGLSEAAVRQRVQRLIDQNVMQIVAVTDPLSVGFTRQAMIGIRADGDLRKVSETIAKIKEVDYVVVCAGRYDLLAEVVCEDDAHLMEILNDTIRNVPGVSSLETFVYLRLEKQSYAWGAR
ncbi:leucine-responsive regulatory protein [Acidithrix ferrooxidans]|uniref:Leucine-responsive regulatory protein n=1 Tax=Acidithrix ferrooxidans TaxID=1280514 RepID=A0A0D8HKE0_9ACTN|nr:MULTISPECIES: Lrp/AsnC family transcriptional regulator [Acidithrix]KJF18420.1 leucine-responsive regulatory protein [Acidithrix ferrooxidans]